MKQESNTFRWVLIALAIVVSGLLIGEYSGAFDLTIGLRALLTLAAGAFLGAVLTDMVSQRTYERGIAPKLDAALVRLVDMAIETGVAFAVFRTTELSASRESIIDISKSALSKVDEIYDRDGENFPRTRLKTGILRIELRSLIERLQENAESDELLELFHEVAKASSAVDKAFTKNKP